MADLRRLARVCRARRLHAGRVAPPHCDHDCRSPRSIVWDGRMPVVGAAAGSRRARTGPVAQWLEPTAHNGLVGGSSPPGPTTREIAVNIFNGLRPQVAD